MIPFLITVASLIFCFILIMSVAFTYHKETELRRLEHEKQMNELDQKKRIKRAEDKDNEEYKLRKANEKSEIKTKYRAPQFGDWKELGFVPSFIDNEEGYCLMEDFGYDKGFEFFDLDRDHSVIVLRKKNNSSESIYCAIQIFKKNEQLYVRPKYVRRTTEFMSIDYVYEVVYELCNQIKGVSDNIQTKSLPKNGKRYKEIKNEVNSLGMEILKFD
ncbi:hypothetical protein [Candidatus Phytoplasma fraxini]|uniref:Uncharacterized protein n=1 Tax=Ash yellows phytoplasma TaxID=35780 RepID=A0ABZ2U8C5_ASHYP